LVATGCSDIFTQDVEDMPRTMAAQGAPRNVTPPSQPRAAAPPAESAEQVEKRKAEGVRRIHIFCRERGIDTESASSPYRTILLSNFEVFCDPTVEVSSKNLSLPELQTLSQLLQQYVKERKHERPETQPSNS
jgi:hypothetical protein